MSFNFTDLTNTASTTYHFVKPTHTQNNDKRVFINASINRNGNTSKMAKRFFGNLTCKQINLSDHNIQQLGQGNGDFDKIWRQLK